MEIPRKFEEATSCKSVNNRLFEMDKKYPIMHTKRITTKYGQTIVFTVLDSESANLQTLLPKRYSDLIAGDYIDKINNNTYSLNLIYKRTCPKTKSYLLATET